MGIWKDKDRQRIRYSFEYRGRRYYGEAATKREARIKRAEHQKRIQ